LFLKKNDYMSLLGFEPRTSTYLKLVRDHIRVAL
jgi:hypothetical protein